MTELDARARALLQAFREQTSPAVGRVEAGLVDVERRLRARAIDDDDEARPVPRTGAMGFYAKAAGLAIAIAAGVLLTIRVAAMGVAVLTRAEPPMRDAASDESEPPLRDASAPLAVPPVESTKVASPPSAPAPSAAIPPVSLQSPAPARSSPPAARGRDDLVAEVALLREAKAQRDAAAALALLDEHAREFPHGSLARERDVLRAERLCTLGRTADARALADRFLTDRGSDPLAQRMRRVCAATADGK